MKRHNSENTMQRLIAYALREDIGSGDITSSLLIPKGKKVKAVLLLKETAIIAGLRVCQKVFKSADASIIFRPECRDGSMQNAGKVIATIEGEAQALLKAERTALNFLSHLSGISTLTRTFVDKVKPYKVKIMDTRKTIPGLRELQKYAVKVGRGHNHRMGLWGGILIKDNHIAASCVVRSASCVKKLVETARENAPQGLKIEIEVINLKEFKAALTLSPDVIMLDNMKIADIKKAVAIRRTACGASFGYAQGKRPKTQIEVSGGVNLDNVREIAKTGIDSISIGSLTHSVRAVDFSLEIVS